MADWYVGSVQHAAVAQWAASTAYVVGDFVRQLAAVGFGSERVFRCTTAGTSGGAEPSWNLNQAGTTNDNAVVWTEVTGNSAYAWSAPYARLATATSRVGTAAGDRIFVASDHAETQNTTTNSTISFVNSTAAAPNYVLCVDPLGSVPPVSADLRTTAQVIRTGTSIPIVIERGASYIYGVQFICQSQQQVIFRPGTTNEICIHTLEDCLLSKTAATSSSHPVFGDGTLSGQQDAQNVKITLINTPISYGNGATRMRLGGAHVIWKDTPNAIQGTIPTTLVEDLTSGTVQSTLVMDGLDLTPIATGTLFGALSAGHDILVKNCELHANTVVSSSMVGGPAGNIDLFVTGNVAEGNRQERYNYAGTLTRESTIVRTDGANDGVAAMSWKIVTSANANFVSAFECFEMVTFNSATGSPLTATVEILTDGVTLQDDEIWIELHSLDDATAPIAASHSTRIADLLATPANVASSAAAWTTTGLGSPVMQKLEVTFTPEIAGLVRARVYIARPSLTVYIDPKLTLA